MGGQPATFFKPAQISGSENGENQPPWRTFSPTGGGGLARAGKPGWGWSTPPSTTRALIEGLPRSSGAGPTSTSKKWVPPMKKFFSISECIAQFISDVLCFKVG